MESAESALIEEKERVLKEEKKRVLKEEKAAEETANVAKEAEKIIEKAEKTVVELQKKLMVIEIWAQEAASRVLIEFRESKEYEDELIDASADAFQLGFMKCEKQVHHLMPKLDLSSIQPDKEPDKSDDEDAEAEEDHPQLTS
uniref:Uncharacterized protein LOC114914572 n=1 Tax=Elaeis guineensis var. tenera TaxID=51953 RepID=A0A8N4IAN8_ELAGV|nr:uncharacterized protein LOC114914572 [Elaeis guineensis]